MLKIIFFTLLYTPTHKDSYTHTTHTQSTTVVFRKASLSVSVLFHHRLCTANSGFPLLYETYTTLQILFDIVTFILSTTRPATQQSG